jgi:hypothetical protein
LKMAAICGEVVGGGPRRPIARDHDAAAWDRG